MSEGVAERVARVRPLVMQVLETESLRAAGERMGVSKGALINLKAGKTPQEDTLLRLEAWAREEGLLDDPAVVPAQPGGFDLREAEEWLREIANPDLLRRQAGTPSGRDVIRGIKSFLFDLSWPVEKKNAVDALLNQIAEDAKASEP